MSKITKSSTAEYFSKNLQQVGFSSPLKAVLTTLKEAVDNSLDACEDAGILPEVRVDVQRVGTGSSKGADLIKVVVEDNGPGISPADRPHIFQRFYRADQSRTVAGNGIGLAVVHQLVAAHRGTITLDDTETGATFIVTLPLSDHR